VAYHFPTISTDIVGKAATVALLDQLREQRATARAAADTILERAATETRDLTADELTAYQAAVVQQREADDAIEAERDREVAELRAAATRRPAGPAVPHEPVLTREQSVQAWAQQRGLFEPPPEGERAPSFDRYIRGLVTGDWTGAEHERALSEGTLTAGGHLVPVPLSSRVIDLARNQMQVMRAGATTVPMTAATLKLARLTSEAPRRGRARTRPSPTPTWCSTRSPSPPAPWCGWSS
jgi:HK97 family phage major capsid protein